VDSPVLAGQVIDQTQLHPVYQQAWETAHGNPDNVRTQKATQVLAQTIGDNFDFKVDRYMTVEDQAFIQFINELGGIDLTLV
jgi:anionic cell wall polymer biosynthesis LytR-Cps2A-Psr (LCP) family protein